MYFSWLKSFNHLYKNIDFDSDLIEKFLDKSTKSAEEFEENTYCSSSHKYSTVEDQGESSENEGMEDVSFFKENDVEVHEPLHNGGKQDYASMFFNKYCEDINLPTVCNQFADIVVDYEDNRDILINEKEDFEIEDENEIEKEGEEKN